MPFNTTLHHAICTVSLCITTQHAKHPHASPCNSSNPRPYIGGVWSGREQLTSFLPHSVQRTWRGTGDGERGIWRRWVEHKWGDWQGKDIKGINVLTTWTNLMYGNGEGRTQQRVSQRIYSSENTEICCLDSMTSSLVSYRLDIPKFSQILVNEEEWKDSPIGKQTPRT